MIGLRQQTTQTTTETRALTLVLENTLVAMNVRLRAVFVRAPSHEGTTMVFGKPSTRVAPRVPQKETTEQKVIP